MLKSYCKKCGGASTYTSTKPNFCQKCGSPFSGVAKTSSPKAIKNVQVQGVEIEASEEEGAEPEGLYRSLSKMDIEIDFVKKDADTLESIWGTSQGSGGIWSASSEGQDPKTEEQVLDQFRKEAGAIRPKPNKDQET